MKYVVAASLWLLPAVVHAQASVLLRSEVSPKEILIGDSVQVNITVVYSSSISPATLEFPKAFGEFELLSSASTQPKADGKGRLEMSHKLVTTTFSTGTVTLPSIALYFKNADGTLAEARTESVPIKVRSLLAEKGDEGNLRPLKGLFNARSLWPIWILVGALVVAAAAWLVIRYRRKGTVVDSGPPIPTLSPEEEAERSLAELQSGTLVAEGQFKEFYSGLSSILRRYIERRYTISASEMTSSELLSAIRGAAVPTETLYTCRAFLDNADLVKFAKWSPSEIEISSDVDRLRSFVSATTPRAEEPAPEPTSETAVPM